VDLSRATLCGWVADVARRAPPGKLADADLHFADGPLAGLKLIGFAF
jgi:hypothetical protein